MKGFFNKILRINLKTKTFKEETVSDSVYETYLGGKGLGTYLLMKENPPGVDPLSPDNKLIFCTGPSPIPESMAPVGMVSSLNLPDWTLFGILFRRQSCRTDEPNGLRRIYI